MFKKCKCVLVDSKPAPAPTIVSFTVGKYRFSRKSDSKEILIEEIATDALGAMNYSQPLVIGPWSADRWHYGAAYEKPLYAILAELLNKQGTFTELVIKQERK